MFIDETTIAVTAGDGGNGCFSYEKVKFKPLGRPNGGNGGRGGDIIIEGTSNMHTLLDASYRKHYKADRGEHGLGKDMYGKDSKDIIILVPLGTLVYDVENNRLLCDCLREGEKYTVANGGRGGRGNGAMANSRNRNPERCEAGKPGESKKLRLVLKMIADVGLVGRPNAGKSTFLSRISKARPKIADYPFTTTAPNLGIVTIEGQYRSFVVADLPGLIEGSHTGRGLGIRFLKHIERTKVLAILIDCQCDDPAAEAKILLNELSQYSETLANKPHCLILTKTDLLIQTPRRKKRGWFSISSATGDGIKQIVAHLQKMVDEVRTTEEDILVD